MPEYFEMNSLIIACNTIIDEMKMAIKETGCKYPVLWIESGLHINPDSLKKRLHEELNHIDNVDQVLLGFGYCGNSVLGLKAGNYRMIFPRADDCITIMLGSTDERKRLTEEKNTYFVTKGWLDYENNIWAEYQETVKRMGKERADRIYKTILKHYERLGVVETGAYELEEFLKRSKMIAEGLNLEHGVIPGTLRFLKKLLTGPWDSEFVVIGPNETVKMDHIYGDLKNTKETLSIA